jgi:hypothetical protein
VRFGIADAYSERGPQSWKFPSRAMAAPLPVKDKQQNAWPREWENQMRGLNYCGSAQLPAANSVAARLSKSRHDARRA